MAKLDASQIERLIYPVSFYRNKARFVKAACEKSSAISAARCQPRSKRWSRCRASAARRRTS